MQTNTQHLLGKLAEEAGELVQIAIKAQQFGLGETFCGQEGPALTNAQRIEAEFNDVLGTIAMLNEEADAGIEQDPEKIEARKVKVKHWQAYARELGLVE